MENGSRRARIEHLLLMHHKKRTVDELTKPWILVPGSFLWRKIEKPDLGYQKRDEIYDKRKEPVLSQI